MRKIILSMFIICLCLMTLPGAPARALDVPPLRARVNDTAEMFSLAAEHEIESLLSQHEKETTNQIAVLTIPSLKGELLEEYSIHVAETWKIGQKGKDNGVILLFSRDDRKIRIEVGYGLEPVLTDLMCGRIISERIVPEFKAGRFDDGLRLAVYGIIGVIKGQITPAAQESPRTSEKTGIVETMKNIGIYILGGILATAGIFLGVIFIITLFRVFLFTQGGAGWLVFVLMLPVMGGLLFIAVIPLLPFLQRHGIHAAWMLIPVASLCLIAKLFFYLHPKGRAISKKCELDLSTSGGRGGRSSWSSSSGSSFRSGSSSSFSSSRSGSSFSGGGGRFGGGGASGGW